MRGTNIHAMDMAVTDLATTQTIHGLEYVPTLTPPTTPMYVN